jgi:hypothetical protein
MGGIVVDTGVSEGTAVTVSVAVTCVGGTGLFIAFCVAQTAVSTFSLITLSAVNVAWTPIATCVAWQFSEQLLITHPVTAIISVASTITNRRFLNMVLISSLLQSCHGSK